MALPPAQLSNHEWENVMASDHRTVSEKRRAANQAAAQQSTGPKSLPGKQRAAFNSFEHGAFATQDHIRHQALAASGSDPAGVATRRQELLADWQPAGAQQALLVDDLAWLYWLRDQARCAFVEGQAQRLQRAQLERDQRRFNARHRPAAVAHRDYYPDGCAGLPPSPDKITTMSGFLDQLSAAITEGRWSDRVPQGRKHNAPALLKFLYGESPDTVRGQQIASLWNECACEAGNGYLRSDANPKPMPDDPRVGQMLALIAEERAALAEEAGLARRRLELDIECPEPSDPPALSPLAQTWEAAEGRLEKLDRQINAKVRLLIRLQQHAAKMNADPPGATEAAPVGAGLAPPRAPQAAPPPTAGPVKTRGTKPIQPLESTPGADLARALEAFGLPGARGKAPDEPDGDHRPASAS
jgi:hypothetical protein